MAEVTWFGTEQAVCPDPDKVGCLHAVGLHDGRADGCSYIGSAGWCLCTYTPERDGAAALLAEIAPVPSPVANVTYARGKATTGPPLIDASATFKVPASELAGATKIECKALVYVAYGKYRACRKQAEFTKWVRLPGTSSQRLTNVCFTHLNAKEVVFKL